MAIRKSDLKLVYNGHDISSNIRSHFIDFNYTDPVDGIATTSLALEDIDELFLDTWFPEDGDSISAEILTYDWEYEGQKQKLPCGNFSVDEIESDEAITIKATAISLINNARGEKKNRAWEKIKLSAIANDISASVKLAIYFDSNSDPFYERKDQENQSDLSFLDELCRSEGLYLKVSDSKLIIIDEVKYEAMKSVLTLEKGKSNIIGKPHFIKSTRELYRACEITFKDPDTGKLYKSYFEAPGVKTGQILKLNEDFNNSMSLTDINNASKKRLREQNKNSNKADFTLLGNTNLVSGMCIDVEGWKKFDGKYFIESVTHTVGTSGFTTSLQTRKCLEGY